MRKLLPLLLCLALFSAIAVAADNAMSGYIVDSKCGAKQAHAGAEACTKKCLAEGAKPVFVDDKTKQVLNISDPEIIQGHEGHRVLINGAVDNGSLKIESIAMLPDSSAPKPSAPQHQH